MRVRAQARIQDIAFLPPNVAGILSEHPLAVLPEAPANTRFFFRYKQQLSVTKLVTCKEGGKLK